MSIPHKLVQEQAARTKRQSQFNRRVEPLPVPADKPVRHLSIDECRAYEAELKARPTKPDRSGLR